MYNKTSQFSDLFAGAALGWGEKQKEIKQQEKTQVQSRSDNQAAPLSVTKTLCFCCEEKEDFFSADLIRRKRKSIKIDDAQQSQQIMLNKEYINDSIRCENQDPIEVVLVVNANKPKTKVRAFF